jgi:hypothetical protein
MRGRARLTSLAAVLIALMSCTGGTNAPTVAASLVSPAPRSTRECLLSPVRAPSIGSTSLASSVGGHVPTRLPDGFGLEGLWGDNEGSLAIWIDGRCRNVAIETWTESHAVRSGPQVGAFTLVGRLPPTCRTPGPKPCFAFQSAMPPGLVEVDTVGLSRRDATRVVRSIQ